MNRESSRDFEKIHLQIQKRNNYLQKFKSNSEKKFKITSSKTKLPEISHDSKDKKLVSVSSAVNKKKIRNFNDMK